MLMVDAERERERRIKGKQWDLNDPDLKYESTVTSVLWMARTVRVLYSSMNYEWHGARARWVNPQSGILTLNIKI